MTPEELRAIMAYLRESVRLGTREGVTPVVITFHPPTEEAMIGAGLIPPSQTLSIVSWPDISGNSLASSAWGLNTTPKL